MKKSRKILSIILALSMLVQLMPVFAAEEAEAVTPVSERPVNYIINDDFGSTEKDESGFDGWKFTKTSEGVSITEDVTYAKTVKDDKNPDNYWLMYASGSNEDSKKTYMKKAFDAPVTFEEGKDVVIETKVMQTLEGGRSYLKYNLVRDGGEQEYDKAWGTLLMNNQGNLCVPNGWATYMNTVPIADATTSKWFDIKITVHGNTKKASYEVTNLSNTPATAYAVVEKTSIENNETANWVEDALNSLEFTLRNPQTLYVDYIRVYEVKNAEFEIEESYNKNGPVTVAFSEADSAFKDAVVLYDAQGNKVDAVNSIDKTNKLVTVTPAKELNDNETYTVGLDINSVPENYVFAKSQKKFIVSPIDYIIYDEFGENDLEGWNLIGTPSETLYAIAKQDTEDSNNYWLEYAASSSEGFNGYVKRVLDTPVTFTENKDVVIETKIKQTEAGGRSMLKYNLVRDGWKEYNSGYGLLFDNEKGTFRAPNGSSTSVSASDVITGSTGDWLDIKITIHGNSKTATYEVKNLTKNTTDKLENRGIANPADANWVENVLNSLEFTHKNGQTLYVDYFKVYEFTDAKMTVEESYKKNEPITVKFDKFNETFVNALSLYDAQNNKVEAVNTIDKANPAVIITPKAQLNNNEKYSVQLDTALIPSNYTVANTKKNFIVSPIDYIIYDEFGENDLEGWEFGGVDIGNEDYAIASTESNDSDNYVMKYTASDATKAQNSYVKKNFATAVKYENGKDIIIETKVKQEGAGGRHFFKYNLVTPREYNEYEFVYSTFYLNNKGSLGSVNGRSADNRIKANNISATETLNKWWDISIKLDSTGKKATITYKDLSTTPATEYRHEEQDISNPAGLGLVEDVLNSLAFTLRVDNVDTKPTLYVDYIKVYVPEQKELALNLANGRYVEYNDSVVLDVTTNEEGLYIPDGTVVLKNSAGAEVSAVAEYDETNKKLTLTPAEILVPGAIYTVAVNENAFIKTATGYSNSFEIEAKKEATEGYTVSDTFDGLELGTTNNASGWYLGTVKDGVGGAIAIVDASTDENAEGATGKALKLTGDVKDPDADGMQTILTKKLDGGIKYKEGETVTVRTRVKYTGTGRAIFEENRPDTLNIPQYLLSNSYYNLFVNRDTGVEYYSGVASSGTGSNSQLLTESYIGQWVDVTMVIDGYNQKMTITAKPQNGAALTKTGETKRCAAVWTNHFGKKTTKSAFDALERLSFTFRKAGGDLYIDYVEVYEAPEVKAELADGRFVQYNQPVEIKLLTDKEVPAAIGNAIAQAISINGTETGNTYDENTKTISLSHNGLTAGEKYTVSVDTDKIVKSGVTYSGTASWEIWARDARKTGSVISDNFDEDNDTFNQGVTKTGREGSVEYIKYDGKSVLKLTSGVLGLDNGEQSNVISMLNGGIEFDSSKDIVIKTSFMHESENTRVFLKFNRPDTITLPGLENVGNLYTLFGLNEGAAMIYPVGVSDTDDRQVALKSIDKSGDYVNKWIDAEIVIHGKSGGVSVKTSYTDDDGNKVTKTAEGSIANPASVYTHAYGIGTSKTGFDALESLTFTFRGDGVKDTLYVDYIDVYTRDTVPASVNFFGDDETSTTTITDGMKVVPVFDFYDDNNGEYVAISAMYKAGRLIDMHITPVTAGPDIRVEEKGYTVTDATNIVIKAFVWDGIDTMVPVSNSAAVKGDEADPVMKIYVSTSGNNGATGEQGSPVADISKALELAKNASGRSEVEIIVEEGQYYLDDTISVNASNRVADKLTIKAAGNVKPEIINGKVIELKNAQKVTDTEITSRLAEESAKDELYKISLEDMTIPGISLPGSYSFAADGVQTKTDTLNITESKTSTCELFYEGKPMTIARYPNSGYSNVAAGFTEGSITRNWMDDSSSPVDVSERVVTPFKITDERAEKWADALDALMFGYWKNDWATQTVPVANISGTTITSKYPSHYGVAEGQRYYVFNLLEEIDMQGEYYIDRKNNILYFMLPEGATAGANSTDKIVISLNASDMLNISASDVVVDGLSFSATRNEAVELSGSNITIKNCEIANTAGTAVVISGTNNRVEGCTIHDVNGGISVGGGNSSTFTAGNNIISGNTIFNFSRLNKTYTFAVSLKGSGNKASDNEISNAEHSAIYFEGTDHTIEYNNIHDVCKEADDAGAIYSNRSWVNRGNQILYNYIHDIKSGVESKQGVAGIFLDDHFAGAFIKGNVFADITGSGIRTNAGRENVITNNIFVKCSDAGCKITSSNNPVASSYATQIKGVEKYLNNSLWQQKYSDLFATDNLGKPMVNTNELIYSKKNEYTKNLSVACGEGFNIGSYATANGTIKNYRVVVSDPGFADMEGKDYSITPDKTKIEGFEEIPFSRMK